MSQLADAIEEFSSKIETTEDLAAMEIRLDALASALLGTQFAQDRLGSDRVARLGREQPNVCDLLWELGRDKFDALSGPAQELIEFSRASVVNDLGAEEIEHADRARQDLYSELQGVVALLGGEA